MAQQATTLSNEQAASIAAVILPMIREYVDSHRDEYEQFLKEWNAKKEANHAHKPTEI